MVYPGFALVGYATIGMLILSYQMANLIPEHRLTIASLYDGCGSTVVLLLCKVCIYFKYFFLFLFKQYFIFKKWIGQQANKPI